MARISVTNNVCVAIEHDMSGEDSDVEESNTNDFVVLPGVSTNILDFQEIQQTSNGRCIDITLPKQLRCFAHLLNLIGKNDFLKNLKDIDSATNDLFNDIYS